MPTKTEKQMIDRILVMHTEGKSQKEIAETLGIAKTTAQRYVSRHKKAEVAAREQKLSSLKKARAALAKKVKANKTTPAFTKTTSTKKRLSSINNLKKANAARAAKTNELDVATKRVAETAARIEAHDGIQVNPSPDTTMREIARAAHVLGLELHFTFSS